MAKASETMKDPMGPPPPRVPDSNPNPNLSLSAVDAPISLVSELDKAAAEDPSGGSTPSGSQCSVPYSIPPWSEPSGHPFSLEVLKDGTIVQQLDVSRKGAYMFGRVDLCDFVLEHPTISRFHAVLQFRKDGEAFLYDLGSTHGTFVNKTQVKKKVYTEVHVGDVFRFGHSSRLYLFQGPSELMPPEGDLNKIWSARIQEEKLDREASLLRAKAEASLADGISWGMSEDAMEEAAENDAEEVTWQTYKGQLTERQEKTRSKIMKRMEKVSNMKKEIDAIRAKDMSQGGLTQGQQTQIARNEQRMSQILEELESLEETLNESIQESIGARSRIVRRKKKGNIEEEDDILSDDDEFYDRTKKKPVAQKSSSQPSVETADTLLAKKDSIITEMEEKKAMLNIEKDKLLPNMERDREKGDDLEAYMSEISSQLVLDKSAMIQKELTNLQTELDRVTYLLKIADPMGEAARQRDVKAHALKSKSIHDITGQPILEQKKSTVTDKPKLDSSAVKIPDSAEEKEPPLDCKDACETRENKPTSYSLVKPQWLGAVKDIETREDHPQAANVDAEESDKFVDYKDREKILAYADEVQKLELAAPGLIIRKRKLVEKPIETSDKARKLELPSTAQAETMAADAVALLLKHKRGYSGLDGEGRDDYQETQGEGQLGVENSQPKRVFGPSRPDFLDTDREYESWVPPEGQSGDGRTALNDQLGY